MRKSGSATSAPSAGTASRRMSRFSVSRRLVTLRAYGEPRSADATPVADRILQAVCARGAADAYPGPHDRCPRSGLALDELSAEIRPQDDLFRHVNGAWLERTEIPEDKARWGSFHLIAEQAEKDVHAIVEESQDAEPGTESRKIGDLYTSFMDTERIAELGASPLAGPARARRRHHVHPRAAAHARRARARRRRRSHRPLRRARPGQPAALRARSSCRAGCRCPTRATTASTTSPTCASPSARTSSGCSSSPDVAGRRGIRRPHLRPRDRARHPPLGQRQEPRRGRDLQPEDLGRGAGARRRRPAPVARGHRTRPRRTPSPRSNVYQPSFLEGLGSLLVEERLEDWKAWLRFRIVHGARRVPVRRVRRRELRVLRHAADRRARQPRALEARRRPRRSRDGRGDRPRLRRAPLPAGRQGRDGRARREPHRGVPAEHHRSRVDEPRDARARARQARRVHSEDRLPGEVAGLLDARDRRRRPRRQRPPRAHPRARPPARSRSASRSTATSGT